MIISTFIVLASLASRQDAYISFGNASPGAADLMLFYRFETMTEKHPPIIMVGSAGIGISFTCDAATKKKMLDSFELQYGVDLRKSENDRPIEHFTRFTIDLARPTSCQEFVSGYSKGSLLGRAVNFALPVSNGRMIDSLTYYYRPYIDDRFRNADAVWADFHLRNRDGSMEDIKGLYVDGSTPAFHQEMS